MSGIPTILLADDDQDFHLLFRTALEHARAPAVLTCASDEAELLRMLQHPTSVPSPELILLDWRLPNAGGLEVLRWIRRQSHLGHVPVLVATGLARDEDREIALRGGATEFIIKPLEFSKLVAMAETIRDTLWGPNVARHAKARLQAA